MSFKLAHRDDCETTGGWRLVRRTLELRAFGINVGGEQSGHLILSDFATTGDGLLAALQVLAVLVQRNRPASEVLQVFKRLPQRLNFALGKRAVKDSKD